MIEHSQLDQKTLVSLIRQGKLVFGGNKTLKIYGRLNCSAGRRMLRKNRVFFSSEKAAIRNGYRPCGHCLKIAYRLWKKTMQ